MSKKELLFALSKIHCCPYCGAKLDLIDGKCSACGMKIDVDLLRRMIFKAVGSYETGLNVAAIIGGLGNKIEWLKTRLRDNVFRKVSEKEFRARKGGVDKGSLYKIVNEKLNGVYTALQQISDLQLRALETEMLDDFEQAYKAIEKFLREYGEFLDAYSISTIVAPEFALKIADNLNKALRVKESMEWYSIAMTSALYPPSSPKGWPSGILWAYSPLSVSFVNYYDADGDGLDEIFAVPSNKSFVEDVPCIIISEFGKVWKPIENYEALLPIFGNFGEYVVITVGWENRKLMDAKFLVGGNELRIVDSSSNETKFSLPVLNVWRGDVDGDSIDELVLSLDRGRLGILKIDGKDLKLFSMFTGLVADASIANKKIFVLTFDGRLLQVDLATREIQLIEGSVANPESTILFSKTFGDTEEIYLATPQGLHRYARAEKGWVKGKVREGDILGAGFADVNDDGVDELLIVLKADGALLMEIYKEKEFLGSRTFEKKSEFNIPVEIERGVRSMETPFSPKPIFILTDIDGDRAPEVIVGGKDRMLIIDLRYEG